MIDPKRLRQEKRFKFYATSAVWLALTALVILFTTIIVRGQSALTETRLLLDITFSEEALAEKSWRSLLNKSLYESLELQTRAEKKQARTFLSQGAPEDLAKFVATAKPKSNSTHEVSVRAKGIIDDILKNRIDVTRPESLKLFSQQQRDWLAKLQQQGKIERVFNRTLFTAGDSSDEETAGIGVALLGSAWMLLVVVMLAVPIGVAAALYMEFFAPPSLLTRWIDAAIKNLAAVPSIVFGILGLAVFINIVGLPRSAPLVGGIVLALMTLPTVIIAARASLAAIPPSLFGMAERGFAARAAAAIMVLLVFLISINGFAVWLRQKMEKKW